MKVLAICTNQAVDPINNEPTGMWFPDLVNFYDELQKKRILIDIASPKGGVIPIDEKSLDLKDHFMLQYIENEDFKQKCTNSLLLSQIDPLDYRIVYFCGGYGALYDFPDNELINEVTRVIYEHNGTVISVGHGAAGLLNVRLSNGELLIKDKYLTASSSMEDRLHRLTKELPYYLEDKLKEKGAFYTKALLPFVEFIEMDERIITGQNPSSARKVASKAIEELFEK